MIICGDKSLKVHKVVLDASSPVLRKLLSGGFKVGLYAVPVAR